MPPALHVADTCGCGTDLVVVDCTEMQDNEPYFELAPQDNESTLITEALAEQHASTPPTLEVQEEEDKPSSLVVAQMTSWLVILFAYSTISKIALKLVDCREIGNHRVAYYAPEYECFSGYNGWQYLLFPFIAAVCLFPGIVVLVTRYLGKESSKPAQSFQPRFWWFEGILMLRRLILTIFSVAPFSEDLRQALLTCGCIVILLIHTQWQPFSENRVNLCESLLLGLLVMISSLSILASHEVTTATLTPPAIHLSFQVDSSMTNDVISVLVLLPVPIVLFLIPWRYFRLALLAVP